MSMRAMRSLDLHFGMVHIPGQIFAIQIDRQGTELSNLCPKCNGTIGVRRYCKTCNQTFAGSEDPYRTQNDMAYKDPEHNKAVLVGDKLVRLEEEELAAIRPPSSQFAQIQYFVPVKNLSRSLPLFAEKVYLWRPAQLKQARTVTDNTPLKAAACLLRQTMTKLGVVGVAKICISAGREHIALVWPEGEVLLVLQMRYESEVRLDYLKEAAEDSQGVQLGEQLLVQAEMVVGSMIQQCLGKELEEDAYIEGLNRLIETKAKGGRWRIEPISQAEPTFDLQAALIASVKATKAKIPAQ